MTPTYLDDDLKPDPTRDEEIAAEVQLHETVTNSRGKSGEHAADFRRAMSAAYASERATFLAKVDRARELVGDRKFDANDHLYTFLALEERKALGRSLYMSERQELARIAFALWPSVRRAA